MKNVNRAGQVWVWHPRGGNPYYYLFLWSNFDARENLAYRDPRLIGPGGFDSSSASWLQTHVVMNLSDGHTMSYSCGYLEDADERLVRRIA